MIRRVEDWPHSQAGAEVLRQCLDHIRLHTKVPAEAVLNTRSALFHDMSAPELVHEMVHRGGMTYDAAWTEIYGMMRRLYG